MRAKAERGKPGKKPEQDASGHIDVDNVVLLVTQDSDIQGKVRAAIEGAGLPFSVATGGVKALRLIERSPGIKLVILDERIPDVSISTLGVDIRDIARDEDRPIYVILLVEEGDGAQGLTTALRAGADDFLAIPYKEETLLSRVQVGVGIVKAMESGLSAMSCHEVAENLVREHDLLRDIRDLLDAVRARIDGGIPGDVLSWCVSVIYLVDYECHMAKEEAYMDAFIDNVSGEHPEWFAEASVSSFDVIQKQHEELDVILRSIKVELARYLRLKANLLAPVNKSIRGYDLGMEIGDRDDALERVLADIKGALDAYYAERESLVDPLKRALSRYVAAVGPHFELEEKEFFPFSCKYITSRDAKKLMRRFDTIDRKAGRERIEAEGAKVKKLLAAMGATDG
jgi:CheY-like chemotaxis protein